MSSPQKEMSAPTHVAPNPDGNGLVSTTQHEGDYTMNPNLQFSSWAPAVHIPMPGTLRKPTTKAEIKPLPPGKNDATTDPVIHAWWKHWPGDDRHLLREKRFFAVDGTITARMALDPGKIWWKSMGAGNR
jgi:hypothetical protein